MAYVKNTTLTLATELAHHSATEVVAHYSRSSTYTGKMLHQHFSYHSTPSCNAM